MIQHHDMELIGLADRVMEWIAKKIVRDVMRVFGGGLGPAELLAARTPPGYKSGQTHGSKLGSLKCKYVWFANDCAATMVPPPPPPCTMKWSSMHESHLVLVRGKIGNDVPRCITLHCPSHILVL